jgi:hypothetical protein
MNDNLGGESFNRKQKLKKLSKTSLRLRGWMKYRIKKSKAKPFVHIRLESFCDLTGKSLRTAKRCLNALRSEDNDLVIRTINQDGVWKIVASTCSRLHGLSRTEPFMEAEDGSKQIVKESMLGKEIKQEQLIVGEDKVYWNAKSNDCLKHLTCNEVHALDSKSSSETPGQMDLNFDPGQSDVFPFIDNGSSKELKVKHQNHQQAGVCSKGIKKLSFFLAREMRHSHYDNIKVGWELPFCYAFAKESLIKRANKRTILKAWDMAVHEIHAEAVDQGITEPGAWRPSSTLSRARRILQDGDCFNRWKPSVPTLKQTKQIVTSGQSN